MGLDLTVYKLKKGIAPTWDSFDWKNDRLAYGRQAWEICGFFGAVSTPDCIAKITLENWADFVDKLAPIGIFLEEIFDAYQRMEDAPEDFPEMVLTDRHKQLIATYELWYNQTWDEYPTRGYFFSVGYMLEFWRAAEDIFRLLEGGEYDVYMIASY